MILQQFRFSNAFIDNQSAAIGGNITCWCRCCYLPNLHSDCSYVVISQLNHKLNAVHIPNCNSIYSSQTVISFGTRSRCDEHTLLLIFGNWSKESRKYDSFENLRGDQIKFNRINQDKTVLNCTVRRTHTHTATVYIDLNLKICVQAQQLSTVQRTSEQVM